MKVRFDVPMSLLVCSVSTRASMVSVVMQVNNSSIRVADYKPYVAQMTFDTRPDHSFRVFTNAGGHFEFLSVWPEGVE